MGPADQPLVEAGTLTRLNPERGRTASWAASDPSDVARVENRTFICSEREQDAGPTNNWVEPDEMRATLDGDVRRLHARAHHVRRAVLDGPDGLARSPQLGVEITDSPYVVVSMRIMTRMGAAALAAIEDRRLVRAGRALGRRAAGSRGRRTWPGRATRRSTSSHFPETREIWSYRLRLRRQRAAGQEVLRAADRVGDGPRRGLAGRAHAHPRRSPRRTGEPHYVAAAFPSACGKTNLAMLQPRSRAGRSRRSATTSPGCGSGRTAGCTPSTRRPGSSGWRRAPAPRPTRTR